MRHVILCAALVGWCSPDAWLTRLNLIRYEFVSILVKLDRMEGEHSKGPHAHTRTQKTCLDAFLLFKFPISDEAFVKIRKYDTIMSLLCLIQTLF